MKYSINYKSKLNSLMNDFSKLATKVKSKIEYFLPILFNNVVSYSKYYLKKFGLIKNEKNNTKTVCTKKMSKCKAK